MGEIKSGADRPTARSQLLIFEDEGAELAGPKPEERKARTPQAGQPVYLRKRLDPVELVIPAVVQKVGAEAFQGCKKLKKVRFEEPSQVQVIEAGAFCDCSNLEEVIFPQSGSLKRIERDAFRRCTALRAAALPKGLHSIGADAFDQCAGLEQVRLPEGLLRIEQGAFALCPRLTEIRIPASVEIIEEGAFYLERAGKGERIFQFSEEQDFAGIGGDTLVQAGRCPWCGKKLPLIGKCGCR